MKLKARSALCVLFVFIVLLSIGLFVGSIDSGSNDGLGLLDQIKDIPDAENGYLQLSYTQEKAFDLFTGANVEEELRQHVYHEKLDDQFVNDVTSEYSEHIENAVASLNYPSFKFSVSENLGELPDYLPFMGLSRLLIIKSMQNAKNGSLDQAIQFAKYAVIFAQRIKADPNHTLISHQIGLVMQYEALVWLHHLVTDYDLSHPEYVQLLAIFDHIPAYSQDSFRQVWSGEFVFARKPIDQAVKTPFPERWRSYWDSLDWRYIDSGYGNTFKEKVFHFLQVLFPKYYLHRNKMLNELERKYSSLSKESPGYCSEVSTLESRDPVVEWSDLIKPNSLGDLWLGGNTIFQDYYTRRCFAHAHIGAVKSIVAIKQYKHKFGKFPESLSLLVPELLSSVPTDPFDGSDLKYSKAKGYIYSVGANFLDDQGSTDAFYVRRCENSAECSQNPTFPIVPEMPVKDEDCPEGEGKNK